jgi:hypothetical protein
MARLDFPDCPSPRPAAEPTGLRASSSNSGALSLPDRVPWDCPGAREIGFTIAERYNASAVLFDNLVAGRGERRAVIGPAGGRTYAQLAADAARWGNAFAALGLSRGDRILLVLDDTPIYPAAFFGAVRAGFVPILVNVLTPPDLLRFYLEDSGAEVAVAEAEFYDRFQTACGGRTPLKTLVVVNGEPSAALRGVDIKKANIWLASSADRLACADTHRNDMAFWMYSSGSTGRPKGIVHLQHDMTYTHQSYARAVLKLTPEDVCFSVPKIFFSYGFGNSITFPFSVGATSLLMPGRVTPAAVFASVARYRPTVFYGLPTLYTLLTHAPEIKDADFSSVRLAVCPPPKFFPPRFSMPGSRRRGLKSSSALAPPKCSTFICRTRPNTKGSALRACGCPATKSCSRTISATKCRPGAKARCGFAVIPARRCSGTSRSEPRIRSATAGYAPAIGWSATRMDFISSVAAKTTW